MPIADSHFDAMLAALQWQPISEYSYELGDVVAVRAAGWLDPAFYGDRTGWGALTDVEREADKLECWRSAHVSDDEQPLSYEPDEFALLTPALWEALTAA